MNKEEALTHFNQVVLEPAIHYALSTLRTYVVEHREELIQAFVESIRQLCIQAKMDQEQQGKSSVAFIHCSMLRMSLVNGSYAYLLEAYSEDWYWDDIGCFHEYDATWAFAPLNELQDSLIVEMKRYGGKLNASDAERMILQAAAQFNAFVMAIARMAVPHILNLPEMQALDRSDRFQIRVGEYKDYSEPVHIREGDHRNIQHLQKKLSAADGLENAYGDYTLLSLPEGSFDHVDVRYSDFSDADFSKCSFRSSILIGTKWHRSNLSETDLRGSVLTDASFRGCNLKGANLSETSDGGNGDGFATTSLGLQGISFERANLENADLRGANLAQADFKEANLTGAQVWIHDRDKYEDQWSDEQLASVLWVALPTREDKEGLWSEQYYELIEDQRILNVFRPPVIDTPYDELPFSSVRRIERKSHDEMTDWITRPAYYMSDRMKRLMENVDETIPFKSVTFINEENGEPFSYWVFKLSNASMFSEKSVFHPDGSLKQLVLDAQAVQDQRIWMLGDVRETRVLVRLDLAESMLRRGFTGFVFRKVEME